MIKKEIEINGKTLRISTGQVAKQAAGSVLVSYGETTIIAAVNAAKEMREDTWWFFQTGSTSCRTGDTYFPTNRQAHTALIPQIIQM